MWKSKIKYRNQGVMLLAIAGLATLILFFQNCSPGFQALEQGANSLGSGSSTDTGADAGNGTPDVPADPNASLSVYVRNTSAKQGVDPVFKIELNKASAVPVTVEFETVAGTALASTALAANDFEALKASVVIPAGALNTNVQIVSRVGSSSTSDKTFSLQINTAAAGSASVVIGQKLAVATIKASARLETFSQISVGSITSCGITTAGAVRCRGYGGQGALANNSMARAFVFGDTLGLAGAKSVSMGQAGGCAITATDTVKCWGDATYGKLGNGTMNAAATPIDVTGLTGVTQIAATGNYHACALTATGAAKCWGYNFIGQLGNGSNDDRSLVPTDVTGVLGAKQIATGGDFTCIITAKDTVQCWGSNAYSQYGSNLAPTSRVPFDVPGLTGIKKIAAGSGHLCVITATNTVKCWGENSRGSVGNNTTVLAPTPVDVFGLGAVKDISLGGSSSCAIDANDGVKCWGMNLTGQIGNGTYTDALVPVAVTGLTGIKSVSVGANGACALTATGTLKCWGGQTGFGALTAVELPGLAATSRSVAVGSQHGCELENDGSVKCWGFNGTGQLGNGTTVESWQPVSVTGIVGAKKLSASASTNCVVTAQDTAKCWGLNASGMLGNNSTVNSTTPVDVVGLTGVADVQAGYLASCALTSTGGVKCWGDNTRGGLGNGTTTISMSPVDVRGVTGATQIATGYLFNCALTSTGGVKCWGYNFWGSLGNGTTVDSLTAVDVTGITGAKKVSISAMGVTACAITSTDTVKCWGQNSQGQFGNGTTTDSSTPLEVPGLTGVKDISVGQAWVCAKLNDGTVKCWGSNYSAGFGTGNLTSSLVPVESPALKGAAQMSVGSGSFTGIVTSGGRARIAGISPTVNSPYALDIQSPIP